MKKEMCTCTDECLGYLTKTCKGIETLEETAERMYREYPNNPIDKPEWNYNRDINCFRKRKAFINGAEWQQERSYSEEDMKEAFRVGFNVGYNDETSPSYLTFEQWFEQFKKK